MICLGDKKYLVASGAGFFREPTPPEPYYIRGTGTPNASFEVELPCIDERTGEQVTVTAHIDIDSNGVWSYPYTGKKIRTMSNLFKGNTNIISIEFTEDLSENVTLSNTFQNCTNLVSVNFGDNADFTKARNCAHTFNGCSSLTTVLNMNKSTLNPTGLTNTFYNCSSLTSVDLSNVAFDGSVSNSTFGYCTSLTSVDLSSAIYSSTTGMSTMYRNCTSLRTIDMRSALLSSVSTITNYFSNCNSLETIRFDSIQASYSILSTIIDSLETFSSGTHQVVIDEDNFTTTYTSQEQQDIEDALNNKGWTLTLT